MSHPDDCLDPKRYPLFRARAVLQELVEYLQSTQDAAGRIQTLTQKLWRPASTSPTATTITQDTQTWTVQYSRAGRITGFTPRVRHEAL